MDNLPATRNTHLPTPVNHDHEHARQLANHFGEQAAADFRRIGHMMTDVLAPLIEQLQQLYPPPLLCDACDIDMARWTPQQRTRHWDSHGVIAKMWGRIRRTTA